MSRKKLFFISIFKTIKNNSAEFLMAALAQFIYLFQSLVQNKIFTNFFPTVIFGKWSLLVSIYTLISMIPFTAFEQGIFKFAYGYKKENEESKFFTSICFVYMLGFSLYSIIFIVGKMIGGISLFQSTYLWCFLLYSFTEIYKNTFVMIDNAYRNRKRVFIIRLVEFITRISLMFLFYYLGMFTIKTVLILMIVSNLIIYIIQYPLLSKIKFSFDWGDFKKIWKKIISFSAPLLAWSIFNWMQNMISRWYLGIFLDYESVAMYSVVTSISFFVPNVVYAVINAYAMPIIFAHNKGFTRKRLFQYVAAVGGILSVYYILLLFLGKYLLLLLTSRQYMPILKYLPFTTFTAIIYVLAMLSTGEIYRSGKTKKLIFPTILPGILMSTVGYLLIKEIGLLGAIFNYMMGHCVYAIFTFLVVFNKKNLSKG